MDGLLPIRALLLLEIGFLGRTNVPHPSWKYSTTKTSTSTYVTSDLPTSRGQSGRNGLAYLGRDQNEHKTNLYELVCMQNADVHTLTTSHDCFYNKATVDLAGQRAF